MFLHHVDVQLPPPLPAVEALLVAAVGSGLVPLHLLLAVVASDLVPVVEALVVAAVGSGLEPVVAAVGSGLVPVVEALVVAAVGSDLVPVVEALVVAAVGSGLEPVVAAVGSGLSCLEPISVTWALSEIKLNLQSVLPQVSASLASPQASACHS